MSYQNNQDRIYGLDIVRSFAIVSVVLSHGVPLVSNFAKWPNVFSVGGFFGVEVFFVLSGFLIGQILINLFRRDYTSRDVGTFLVRRWFRTLPNYFLFLAINLALLYFIQGAFPRTWGYYLIFMQNFAWPSIAFFGESWSLAVEEWFYLLSPATFLLCCWLVPNRRIAILCGILIIVVSFTLVRLGWVAAYDPSWSQLIRKAVVLRLDALGYGLLAAYVKIFHATFWRRGRIASAVVGVLVLVVSFYVLFNFPKEKLFFSKTLLFSTFSAGVALTMPLFDALETCPNRFLRVPVESISQWSYSMYLVHLPLFMVLTKVVEPALGPYRPASLAAGLVECFLWIGLTILLSWLIHIHFERPMMQKREFFSRREPALA